MWEVEYTDNFEQWWDDLDEREQESIAAYVGMLEDMGATLPYPFSSGVVNSRYTHMRELRVQHQGKPYRVLYAFDPKRVAILLIGGCKEGDDRWYDKYIPIADKLYAEHLKALEKEEN
jgi:hypothetical protein